MTSGLTALLSTLTHEPGNTQRPPMARRSIVGGLTGTGQTSMTQALDSYGTTSWLFATVGRIAEATAQVHWTFGTEDAKAQLVPVAPTHPLAHLWEWVNAFSDRSDFIETTCQHFDLVGETDWLLVYNRPSDQYPAEIWPLRPDRVRPIPDPEKFIAGWVYQNGPERILLGPNQIIQMKRPNPSDPYRGAGVVQAIIADCEGERAAAQWQRNFFTQGATFGTVIEYDERLSDPEYEEQVMRLRENHQGVANAHRILMLERGHLADRKYTQRDMQMIDYRKWNRDVIFGALGMHGAIMGVAENINRANALAAETQFARWLVRSRLDRYKTTLERKLFPYCDEPDLRAVYVDPVPEDRELLMKAGNDGWLAGLLTYEEGRKAFGYPTEKTDPLFGTHYEAVSQPDVAKALPLPDSGEAGPKGASSLRITHRVERDAQGRLAAVIEERDPAGDAE